MIIPMSLKAYIVVLSSLIGAWSWNTKNDNEGKKCNIAQGMITIIMRELIGDLQRNQAQKEFLSVHSCVFYQVIREIVTICSVVKQIASKFLGVKWG